MLCVNVFDECTFGIFKTWRYFSKYDISAPKISKPIPNICHRPFFTAIYFPIDRNIFHRKKDYKFSAIWLNFHF